jgi:hypothetical protein
LVVNLLATLLLILVAFQLPAYSQTAPEVTVPPGYQATVISRAPDGLRYNDIAFTPWGDLIASAVSQTRNPCDSYIAQISASGEVTQFADICVDNPMPIAFNPAAGDLLYFLEGSGFNDDIYTVPSFGSSGDVRFLAGGFVVGTDMAFGPDGSLYVADIYRGRISRVTPTGSVMPFAMGFSIDTSGYAPMRNMWLGLAFDAAGNLLVADSGAGAVFLVLPTGQKVVYSRVTPRPSAVAIAPNGDMYVADIAAGNVHIVAPDGASSLFASGLSHPLEIEFAPDGSLYILEWMNVDEVFPPTRVTRIHEAAVPSVDAVVDVKPETLNLASLGRFVTCYIELPDGLNVADIATDSVAGVAVNGVPAVAPVMAAGPAEVGDYDADGVADLMVKFDRRAVSALITIGEHELTVSGDMADGTKFRGSDSIRVLNSRRYK